MQIFQIFLRFLKQPLRNHFYLGFGLPWRLKRVFTKHSHVTPPSRKKREPGNEDKHWLRPSDMSITNLFNESDGMRKKEHLRTKHDLKVDRLKIYFMIYVKLRVLQPLYWKWLISKEKKAYRNIIIITCCEGY